MFENNSVVPFDGTVSGLVDQLGMIAESMPKPQIAFVEDALGNQLSRIKVRVKNLTDGSVVWDVVIY